MARFFAFLCLFLTAASAFAAGPVELISRADPLPDTNGASYLSAMSADGRYVAFQSDAPNLVPGQVDDNGILDVFLRDRVAGTTTLVTHVPGAPSRASAVAGFAYSFDGTLSADGRYLAFAGLATQLVPGVVDANDSADVFLYDRVTGATTLISHAAGQPGVPAGGISFEPRISADGNLVAFASFAGNLVAGQTAPAGTDPSPSIFLYDRRSGALTLLSHASGSPTRTAQGGSGDIAISADGSYVLFGSTATDLVAGMTSAHLSYQVFLYERSSGALTLVSHAAGSPLAAPENGCGNLLLSADGRWIAFHSNARNLVPGQIDPSFSTNDAFLYDRVTGQTRLVSHTTASPLTAAGINVFAGGLMALSGDGRYLAFASEAPDVIPGQVNLAPGINLFVYDRVSGGTTLVSHHRDSGVTTPSRPGSSSPSLSADGRWIAFASVAGDLIPHQTDPATTSDVFVYDQTTHATVLASHVRASLSTAAGDSSNAPLISADGGAVVFSSYATDLGAGQADADRRRDLFLFERASAEVTPLNQRAPDLPSVAPSGPSSASGISADGRFVVFVSEATGLVPGQVDTPYAIAGDGEEKGTWDVFLRDRALGKTTLLSRTSAAPPTAAGGSSPAISADGEFVAFRMSVPNGSQPAGQVFLYDRTADTYRLLNAALPPASGSSGFPAGTPAISADGRYVAFACAGCTLVRGQQDGGSGQSQQVDIFLYDRVAGAATLVSHASGAPATPGNDGSQAPRISADGRYVVFLSRAKDLVAGQGGSHGSMNAFVFDRATGAVALVSHTAGSPVTPSAGGAYGPEISADGRWVIFWNYAAADLVPGQTGSGQGDVYLYDRAAGTNRLVSHVPSSPVTGGNDGSGLYAETPFSLSADGRWIVFLSAATDLVAGVSNPGKTVNVYLYDRTSGVISLVSSAAGASGTASNSWTAFPRISADGGRITFQTPALNLIPGQPERPPVVTLYVQERATGARTPIGRTYGVDLLQVDSHISLGPWLSADGRQIAFTSDAAFAPGDFNGAWDAYLFSDAAGGPGVPVPVPPCRLFDGSGLRSNARQVLAAAGVCGVPVLAKRVTVKVTASQETGQGNVRFYPGDVTSPANPAGVLRFQRGQAVSGTFDLPLGANGTLALLPFVRGNGKLHLVVEVDGYTP
jgi:Tol biopolymer transport system component